MCIFSKLVCCQRLGEDVHYHVVCWAVAYSDILCFYCLPEPMVFDSYMPTSRFVFSILNVCNCRQIIISEQYSGFADPNAFHGKLEPLCLLAGCGTCGKFCI